MTSSALFLTLFTVAAQAPAATAPSPGPDAPAPAPTLAPPATPAPVEPVTSTSPADHGWDDSDTVAPATQPTPSATPAPTAATVAPATEPTSPATPAPEPTTTVAPASVAPASVTPDTPAAATSATAPPKPRPMTLDEKARYRSAGIGLAIGAGASLAAGSALRFFSAFAADDSVIIGLGIIGSLALNAGGMTMAGFAGHKLGPLYDTSARKRMATLGAGVGLVVVGAGASAAVRVNWVLQGGDSYALPWDSIGYHMLVQGGAIAIAGGIGLLTSSRHINRRLAVVPMGKGLALAGRF